MEKSGPELSPKLESDAPSDGCDGPGLLRFDQIWSSLHTSTFCELWRKQVKATNKTHLCCSPSRGLHEQFETLKGDIDIIGATKQGNRGSHEPRYLAYI